MAESDKKSLVVFQNKAIRRLMVKGYSKDWIGKRLRGIAITGKRYPAGYGLIGVRTEIKRDIADFIVMSLS